MSMSEQTFVELLHDLGDVDGPTVDSRPAAIHRRIQRVHRRRTAFTAAAAVIVVLAAALGVVLATSTSHVTPANRSMPASWTAADGVVYRRIDLVTLDTGKQKSVTVTVPTSAPIAVRSTCDDTGEPRPAGAQPGMLPLAGVGLGGVVPSVHQIDCHLGRTPVFADFNVTAVAHGADHVQITLTGVDDGMGDGPQQVYPAKWTFGIYVWVVPATLRTVPGLPAMPTTQDNFRLADTVSGTWPAQRSLTFHIPANTVWGISVLCSGTFAGAAPDQILVGSPENAWSMAIDGKDSDGGSYCQGEDRIDENNQPGAEAAVAHAISVTITFGYDAIYDQRSGRIEVGVYYQQ